MNVVDIVSFIFFCVWVIVFSFSVIRPFLSMKRRKVLASGCLKIFWFCCMDEFDSYLRKLERRKICYRVLESCPRLDGTVLVRILQQYNNADLIQI